MSQRQGNGTSSQATSKEQRNDANQQNYESTTYAMNITLVYIVKKTLF